VQAKILGFGAVCRLVDSVVLEILAAPKAV